MNILEQNLRDFEIDVIRDLIKLKFREYILEMAKNYEYSKRRKIKTWEGRLSNVY